MSKENNKTVVTCAPELAGRTDTARIRALTGINEEGMLPEEFFHVSITAISPEGTLETARAAANFLRECEMAPPLVVRDDLAVDLIYKITDPPEDLPAVKARAGQVVEMIFGDSRRRAQITIDEPLELEGRIYDGTVTDSGIGALDRVGWYLPETPEKPHEVNNYDPKSYSIRYFLKIHGIEGEEERHGEVIAYRLTRDAMTEAPSQTASFYEKATPDGPCIVYHDVAPGKTATRWDDVRKKWAPDPEEKVAQQERQRALKPIIARAVSTQGPTWGDIVEVVPEPEKAVLSTGLPTLDKILCGGLRSGELTILTGLPASGKSTYLSQLISQAAELGTKCGLFSGELTPTRVQEWLVQQLAGEHCVKAPSGRWTVPEEVREAILEWLKGRVYLYNNDSGMQADHILQSAETAITAYGLGLLILDNFMMMDTGITRAEDSNQAQTRVCAALQALAKKYNIVIILVAHPRKVSGFLSGYDVSGTANLFNLCDNLLTIHRITPDFVTNVTKIYGLPESDPLFAADNAIQVLKNRGDGRQGDFIALTFGARSRTLTDMRCPLPMSHAWEVMQALRSES